MTDYCGRCRKKLKEGQPRLFAMVNGLRQLIHARCPLEPVEVLRSFDLI
jgi:hypothetical protein